MQGAEFAEIKKELAQKYSSWQEGVYCVVNDIVEPPLCKNCGKPAKFQSIKIGYSEYCSHPCSVAYGNKTLVRKKKTFQIYNKNFREFEQLLKKEKWDIEDISSVLSKFESYSQINQDTNPLFPKLREQLALQNDGSNTAEQIYLFNNNLKEVPCCKHCDKKLYGKFVNHNVGFRTYCSSKCSADNLKTTDDIVVSNPKSLRYLAHTEITEENIDAVLDKINLLHFGRHKRSNVIKNAQEILSNMFPNATSLAECIWLRNRHYDDVPKCECCNKPLIGKFISTKKGYFKTCSLECNSKIQHMKYIESGKFDIRLQRVLEDYQNEYISHHKNIYRFKHICGHEYETPMMGTGQIKVCPKCKEQNISRPHQQVLQFCRDHYDGTIEINDRTVIKPLELDLWFPDLNLAIEVDGVFWHQKEKDPQKKKLLCAEKGINLLHISDFEWYNNLEAWENIILSKLKKQERIFARNCKIQEITAADARDFCDKHHFQKYAQASMHLGLFYNDELVAYMSFGTPRFNRSYQYELIRFCSYSGHTIVGGASKLYKYFLKTYSPKSIISYANANYSDGNLYRKLGMTLVRVNKSSYVYIRDEEILSRYACQKHKLEKLLEHFDPNLTELQNMENNGYVQFFDRGTLMFEYKA